MGQSTRNEICIQIDIPLAFTFFTRLCYFAYCVKYPLVFGMMPLFISISLCCFSTCDLYGPCCVCLSPDTLCEALTAPASASSPIHAADHWLCLCTPEDTKGGQNSWRCGARVAIATLAPQVCKVKMIFGWVDMFFTVEQGFGLMVKSSVLKPRHFSQSALKHNLKNWNFITLLCVYVSVLENVQLPTRVWKSTCVGSRHNHICSFWKHEKKANSINRSGCWHSLAFCAPASFWRGYNATR